jgi:hypothetical protein
MWEYSVHDAVDCDVTQSANLLDGERGRRHGSEMTLTHNSLRKSAYLFGIGAIGISEGGEREGGAGGGREGGGLQSKSKIGKGRRRRRKGGGGGERAAAAASQGMRRAMASHHFSLKSQRGMR